MSANIMRYRWLLLLLLVGLGAVCASALPAEDNDAPPRTVASPQTIVAVTVSLDGKPLTSGRIFFHLPKDQFAGGKIKSGKCQLDCVPAGTHKVTIESKGLPKHYSSFEQAALVVEIVSRPRKNSFAFELVSD